ncbi:hypothetical protein ACHAWF_014748 [Thalassiosira exigua]
MTMTTSNSNPPLPPPKHPPCRRPRRLRRLVPTTSLLALVVLRLLRPASSFSSSRGRPIPLSTTVSRPAGSNDDNDGGSVGASSPHQRRLLYLDVAISTPSEDVPLGRLTFRLAPPDPLPLHASNLEGLASGVRRSVDPKATYEGCTFQFSPASIDDGSFRYRWGHHCEGYGRNAIRTTTASGRETSWDEPFSDPGRLKEASHECFGGVYYGQSYSEITGVVAEEGWEAAVLLTVPIRGPGAGTSKFSVVRVSESPREWGERLLHNSAVMGFLDCGANGSFEGASESSPTSLDVLRAMARQRMGPPKIVQCGVESE